MLLNRIPCLDKGYVALVDSSCDWQRNRDISTEFLGITEFNPKLAKLSSMVVAVKCPIFVQLHLSQYGFFIANTKPSEDVEAYCPNAGEIGGKDVETNRIIAEDIERTTAALLINPRAYQADGCDRFVSQLIMPISTYTTILVSGTYEQWSRLVTTTGLPAPVESYRTAVKQIFAAEWKP